jgi:hypothetical protein
VISIPEDFFKNSEEVKTEIRKCALFGGIICILSLLSDLVGISGDAIDITLVLESETWLFLAVFSGWLR